MGAAALIGPMGLISPISPIGPISPIKAAAPFAGSWVGIMAKTKAIVNRRKAIRNIRKITRTMELIATARFKKALDRAVEAEAYTRKIAELAADLSASATDVKHPLLEKREEVRNSLLLVL